MMIPIEALPLPAARTGASGRRHDGGEFVAALEAILAGGADGAEAGEVEADDEGRDGDGFGPTAPGRAAVTRVFDPGRTLPAGWPAGGADEDVDATTLRAGFEAALAADLFGPDVDDRAMQLLADVDPDDLEAALSLADVLVDDEELAGSDTDEAGATGGPEPMPEPDVGIPEAPGDDRLPAAVSAEDEPAGDHEDVPGGPRPMESGRDLGAERPADSTTGRSSPIAGGPRADAVTHADERPAPRPGARTPEVGASRRAGPVEGRPSPSPEEQRFDATTRVLEGRSASRAADTGGRASATAPVGEEAVRAEPEPARGSSPVPPPGEPSATDARPAPPAPTRPAGLPPAVQRVLDAVAELEHAPPPRQVTVEVGESRLRIGLEEGSVRLTLLDGDGDTEELLREAAEALAERGFDLAGDQGSGAEGEASDDRAGPDELTTPRRPRARTAPGLRL